MDATYLEKGYNMYNESLPVDVVNTLVLLIEKSFGRTLKETGKIAAPSPITSKETFELYSDHFFPLMTFHWGITPFMNGISGKELLPSYCNFRLYQKGDVCKIHTDRLSCEHSLNLTLAYSDDLPWEFHVGHQKQEVGNKPNLTVTNDFSGEEYSSLIMQPGDCIAYQGITHRHGRLHPNPNHWSAHLFMHWVDRNGPFSQYAFDGKKPRGKAEFFF